MARTPVLFISSAKLGGGADTFIHLLLMKHLDRERYEVHLACAPPTPGASGQTIEAVAPIPGLSIRHTDFGPSLSDSSGWRRVLAALRLVPAATSLLGLALYVRRHRIAILHSTDRPRDAISCALLGRLTGARSVIHLHVKFDQWMSTSVKRAFRRADALIGVSEFVVRSLEAGGYPREKLYAAHNAIVPGDWDPALDGGPFRESLGIPRGAPVIASASRLFRWKGHADLLRAVALVQRELPEVRLVIAGADFPPGSGVTAELRALASELGLADRVHLTGQIAEVGRVMAAGDVFALASFEEPFGLVFAEAMALKRPVVAIDNGGTPEVVDDGGSGLLASPGDVKGLADRLLRLLRDPALRTRMGEHGRKRVEALFTPDRMARRVEQIYDALVPPRTVAD